MPFELNLIPTQTVTGQYNSLLVTRRHFLRRDCSKRERGDYQLFLSPAHYSQIREN